MGGEYFEKNLVSTMLESVETVMELRLNEDENDLAKLGVLARE